MAEPTAGPWLTCCPNAIPRHSTSTTMGVWTSALVMLHNNWKTENHPKTIPANHQGHHIIPDNVVRDNYLFKKARLAHSPPPDPPPPSYDLDRAPNIDQLPKSHTDRQPGTDGGSAGNSDRVLHNGSHKKWDAHVRKEINDRLIAWANGRTPPMNTSDANAIVDAWYDLDKGELLAMIDTLESDLRADLKAITPGQTPPNGIPQGVDYINETTGRLQ